MSRRKPPQISSIVKIIAKASFTICGKSEAHQVIFYFTCDEIIIGVDLRRQVYSIVSHSILGFKTRTIEESKMFFLVYKNYVKELLMVKIGENMRNVKMYVAIQKCEKAKLRA